jgi:hypothetical protein
MNKNVAMISEVARGLKKLNQDVVFVGGATATLYIYDSNPTEIRPTDDVDCIIELHTKSSHMLLSEKLIALGFSPDSTPKAPLCRYKYLGITVDIMPTDEKILGFSNKWYREGYKKKIKYKLPDGQEVWILPLAFFIATKIEAFFSRGAKEPRLSHDLEDMVIILAEVEKLRVTESASPELEKFLKQTFSKFLKDDQILEAIRGHNPYPEIPNSINKIMDCFNI